MTRWVLVSAVIAAWFRWLQLQRPSHPKTIKHKTEISSFTTEQHGSNSHHSQLAAKHARKYQACAHSHLEAIPAALVTDMPPRMSTDNISSILPQASLDPQPDSIAAKVYPSSFARGKIGVSVTPWPPELEQMAQVNW